MYIFVEPLVNIEETHMVAKETQGLLPSFTPPTVEKWKSWLDAEESQIRVFELRIRIEDIPYWVHVQLVRHHIGIEWFVRSQRPDSINPVNYDRRKAPQDELISLTMICNPQSLINISRKRLCFNASLETRQVWSGVKNALLNHGNPYIKVIGELMVPDCKYRGGHCHQVHPCGMFLG